MSNGRLISTLAPESKLTKWLYLTDLAALALGAGLFFMTHTWIIVWWLKVCYGILITIIVCWSIYQPSHNPKKRNYQVLLLAFKRDRSTYHTITYSELTYYNKDLKERSMNDQFIDLTEFD